MQLGLVKSPAAFRQHSLYIILIFSFIKKILFYINWYKNHPPTLYLYQRSISRVTHPLPLINLRNPFYSKNTSFIDTITSFAIYSEGSTFKEECQASLVSDIFLLSLSLSLQRFTWQSAEQPGTVFNLTSVIFLQQLVLSAIILMYSSLRKFGFMLCPFAFYIDTSVPMGFRSSLFRYRQWIV